MGKIRGGSFEILYYFKTIEFYLRKRKVSRIELLSVPAFDPFWKFWIHPWIIEIVWRETKSTSS